MEHLVNWRGFSWTNFQTRAIELKLASFQKSLSGPKVGVEKKLDLSLDLNSIKKNFELELQKITNLVKSHIIKVQWGYQNPAGFAGKTPVS